MKKIGFIGLGAMGKHMANNLVKAGFELTVYDKKNDLINTLTMAGAKAASSCGEAAKEADVVITMLPADSQMKEVMLGSSGVIESARPGTTLIDMTTLSPLTSREVAEKAEKRNLYFMDAPVSGGTKGAEQGTLSIMVGGEKKLVEKHRDILEAMGKRIFHVGGIGNGVTVKMVNQMLVGSNILAICEAFVLGVKLGAEPKTLFEIIKISAGGSFILNYAMENYILPGDFEKPGFALNLLHKDVGIALDSAKEAKVAVFITSLINQLLTQAISSGYGNLDMSSVIKIFEKAADVQIKS